MDLTVLLAAISGVIIIILVGFLLRRSKDEVNEAAEEGLRRPQAARGARARMRAAAAAAAQHTNQPDEEGDADHEKIGAKKRAKLEAKAEKKAQREAEEQERKKRKGQLEEERAKQAAREEEEEAKREEEERRAEEEREQREHEEYLKMKAAFTVDEEGFDEDERDEADLVEQFIKYIQDNKVVILEDLAFEFKLKTQAVIDRIKDLQSASRLTGVVDDRGKFIYISEEELSAVAKFVKQRGRVSITELAENSQRLINLTPKVS